MNIASPSEKSIGFKGIIPFITVFLLILFMVLPYKLGIFSDIMPFLTLIGVYYWSVFRPELLPTWCVFLIGLIQDILMGSPFGMMPLLLVITQQVIFYQGRRFLERDFIFNWLVFVMLVAGFAAASWGIASLYFRTLMEYWGLIGQALMTVAFYPIITWAFSQVRKLLN